MTFKGLLIIIYIDLVLPLAVLFNLYLYFYPVFYGCAFPRSTSISPIAAPFRLLTLADPQLEGDSVLRRIAPPPPPPSKPHEELSAQERFLVWRQQTLYRGLRALKTLDLWGNDLYLAHVHKTVRRLTSPTHTVLLGDLLGSQWIDDAEFERRSERWWRIVGANASALTAADLERGVLDNHHGEKKENEEGGEKATDWRWKMLTVAGNHDVGYAGDMTRARLERFQRMFGPTDYSLRFHHPAASSPLTVVVLNSLVLDRPIADPSLAEASTALLDRLESTDKPPSQTLLLTHLPLHKKEGLCADAPGYGVWEHDGSIRWQNMLSEGNSARVLAGIMRQGGVIMTGHDHVGCDVVHSRANDGDGDGNKWVATRIGRITKDGIESEAEPLPESVAENGIREITVRSMMGEFGGNVGLLSAWWDADKEGESTILVV